MTRPAVLLLGGTSGARTLAENLPLDRIDLTVSLAGRTRAPANTPGRCRTGGFGGAAGLARWLEAERIAAVVDATHPFATGITRNAAVACAQRACPLLILHRPGWGRCPEETWDLHRFASLEAAIAALPAGARPFLATGSGTAALLGLRPDLTLLLRAIEPVDVPDKVTLHLGRPPFAPAAERALMEGHRITHLVTKDAGGAQGRAKLVEAGAMGLPIFLVDQPALPDGVPHVVNWGDAKDWLMDTLPLDTPSGRTP